MNVLLLGAGGREHALAWKLSQSGKCSRLFIAPGNAGTLEYGENLTVNPNDFESLNRICSDKKIDLVVVGPEEPLVNGIVDYFKKEEKLQNIPVIGPSASGARLEGSKAFAKQFMFRHNIPTANYREFDKTSFEDGVKYLKNHSLPIVLKADGLAAGKGVIICHSNDQAVSEFTEMLQQDKFGNAGSKVVVEEFLEGIELSVFVLSDGKNYILLPEAKDYKRIGEGDTGPNTGGMGAVSPVPFAGKEFMEKVDRLIIKPTVKGLAEEHISYTGFIFFGLIKVGNDPYVIEYNCRMGDPETEVVMPRLENDLMDLFLATAAGKLDEIKITHKPEAACTIMAVSGGYPGNYKKGFTVTGTENNEEDKSIVFHAGTTRKNDTVETSGGRVLCVTSLADTISEAAAHSRKRLEGISFEGMYYRKDIGYEFEA